MTRVLPALTAVVVLATASLASAQQTAPTTSPSLTLNASEVEMDERDLFKKQTRYRRLRISGAVLMAAYLPLTLGIAGAVSRTNECAEGEFCVLNFNYGAYAAFMSGFMSPVLISGATTFAIGTKRGNRLKLNPPSVAYDPRARSTTLWVGGSF